MFKGLKDFFSGSKEIKDTLDQDQAGNVTDHDLHVATAVLLVEMAGADKEIAPEEAETLCVALQEQFGIPAAKVPEIVQTAIASRKEKGKIDEFVNLINQRFNDMQRQRILAMIWKVVLADEKIDKFEERFATQIKYRFKLTDEQAARAREMAEGGEV
ncbi:MAG: TerB family tellurite resistance protein [Candidatus Dadabacteria bacterium]|nr:MAG: TerB family tellurite resistance protein [Candidatus Dadabacteria bacterium]